MVTIFAPQCLQAGEGRASVGNRISLPESRGRRFAHAELCTGNASPVDRSIALPARGDGGLESLACRRRLCASPARPAPGGCGSGRSTATTSSRRARCSRRCATSATRESSSGRPGISATTRCSVSTLLGEYGLALVGAFAPVRIASEDGFRDDLPFLDSTIDILVATGVAGPVVLAADENDVRLAVAGRPTARSATSLQGDDLKRAAERVQQASDRAAARGVAAAFHPHTATYIESPEEVTALLELTSVDICFDTGHCIVGGGDPVEMVRSVGDRITHLHLKDVDPRSPRTRPIAGADRRGSLGARSLLPLRGRKRRLRRRALDAGVVRPGRLGRAGTGSRRSGAGRPGRRARRRGGKPVGRPRRRSPPDRRGRPRQPGAGVRQGQSGHHRQRLTRHCRRSRRDARRPPRACPPRGPGPGASAACTASTNACKLGAVCVCEHLPVVVRKPRRVVRS